MKELTTKDLIERGYFPEELPPFFSTKSFADNFGKLAKEIRKKQNWPEESLAVRYSIPKGRFSRRNLSIPNPLVFLELAELIANNRNDIQVIYNRSKISISKPKRHDQRAVKPEKNFNEFKNLAFAISSSHKYELKTDITRYYPSMYTHSIPWAMHSKAASKKNRGDGLLGNKIDRILRKMQSGQTVGIPIGPDTSFIVSELVGAAIDQQLVQAISKEVKGVKIIRFADDYYFYFSSKSDGMRILAILRKILADFELEINEAKTKIGEFPNWHCLESEWAMVLQNFQFIDHAKELPQFFNAAFRYAEQEPNGPVLKYAARILKDLDFSNEHWPLAQNWLQKMFSYNTATLPYVAAIFIENKDKVDTANLAASLASLIDEHCELGHSYEVSWALYLAKEFGLIMSAETFSKILKSGDVISSLVVLDMKSEGQVTGRGSLRSLIKELNDEDVFLSDKWLLAYEARHNPRFKKLFSGKIKDNNGFKLLRNAGVIFYKPQKSEKIAEAHSETFTILDRIFSGSTYEG